MPWKASSVVEERLKFVVRLIDGEPMTDLCREYGVSRKTGYKIFNRYKADGVSAFSDRSHRPVRYANQLPPQVESLIVRLKREKPHWGARKLRALQAKSGAPTIPQIFVGGEFIGGASETLEAWRTGELSAALSRAGVHVDAQPDDPSRFLPKWLQPRAAG